MMKISAEENFKSAVVVPLFFLISTFLLTFKLTQVPPGIDSDEGVIAYNAGLIARTLHDQNGRFLPAFVLATDKIAWHQPVTVYLSALFFKVFGPSLVIFKLVSVFISLITLALLFYLFYLRGL